MLRVVVAFGKALRCTKKDNDLRGKSPFNARRKRILTLRVPVAKRCEAQRMDKFLLMSQEPHR